MAKTVAEKLLVKPGNSVYLVASEAAQRELLNPLPDGAAIVAEPGEQVAVLFAKSRAELDQVLAAELGGLTGTRAVWVAYPKGGRADINRDSIFAVVQEFGWIVNSNVAMGEVWSALRMKPVD